MARHGVITAVTVDKVGVVAGRTDPDGRWRLEGWARCVVASAHDREYAQVDSDNDASSD